MFTTTEKDKEKGCDNKCEGLGEPHQEGFGLKKRQFSESWDRKNVAASKSFADVTRPDIDRENLEKGDKIEFIRSFDDRRGKERATEVTGGVQESDLGPPMGGGCI